LQRDLDVNLSCVVSISSFIPPFLAMASNMSCNFMKVVASAI
ncbi:hypothetical protein CSUI_009624, partial [Cystoisospora suis]